MTTLFAPPAGAGAAVSSLSTSAAGLSSMRIAPSPSPSPLSGGGSIHRPPSSLSSGVSALSLSKHSKGLKSAAVVLELGEAYLRAGFAGETYPRHIVSMRDIIAKCRPNMAAPDARVEDAAAGGHTLTREQLAEASLELSTSRLFISNPYHRFGMWYPLLTAVFRHIYFHVLHVNPRDRRLMIVENMGWSQGFKRALGRAVCEVEVPAIMMVRGMEAAMFTCMPTPVPRSLSASSPSTALVIDIGWSETRMLPIYMGTPLHHLLVTVPLGMWDVQRRFGQLLSPLLRMEYAQLGGDMGTAYYLAEESKLLGHSSLERLLSTMSYVQPFHLSLDAFQAERDQKVLSSPTHKKGASSVAAPASQLAPSPQIPLPPPLPPIPSSTAAMDLPAPLPFPWFLHAAPPSDRPLPGFAPPSADLTSPSGLAPLPAMVSLPAVMRWEAYETLFEFDRCSMSSAAAARNQEVSVAPSGSSNTDLANARGSHAEQGLAATLVDLLCSDLGSGSSGASSLRVALASNIVLLGGGGMVAGLAERLVDETNWMLGGAHVPGRIGRARAEKVAAQGAQNLQNKIALNACSSAVSAAPLPPLPGQSLPSIPGPTPSSAPIVAPSAPTPFSSNCVSWIGSSVLGCCDLADDEWLSLATLAALVKPRAAPEAAVEARRAEVGERRKAAKAPSQQGQAESAEQAPSHPSSSSGFTAVPSPPFPDYAHPDSALALTQVRAQVALTAATLSSTATGLSAYSRTGGLPHSSPQPTPSPSMQSASPSPSPAAAVSPVA